MQETEGREKTITEEDETECERWPDGRETSKRIHEGEQEGEDADDSGKDLCGAR